MSFELLLMYPYRTRFKKEIVAEFLPPSRYNPKKPQKVIIICDGMPGIPRKRPFLEFLSKKGYWAIYPRYRGAWESDGLFLQKSPEQDILDVIDGLYKPFSDLTWGKKFRINPSKIYIIGGSFGGPAAILLSRDERVAKVVVVAAVVDWAVLKKAERAETTNPSYVDYIHKAFGQGYRLTSANWNKLYTGKFYNPMAHVYEIDGAKVLMYHAADDQVVPAREARKFAKITGAKLILRKHGGHLNSQLTMRPSEWRRVSSFFTSK